MPEEKDSPKTESGYTPASPVKRTMAWIGIVYMIIVVVLTTYIYATGQALHNLAPLLAVPALAGLGALSIVSWRSSGKPGKWTAILLALLCWAAALYSLFLGVVGLLSNFPGALDRFAAMLPGTLAIIVTGG